jgi:hypothetical protein
MTGPFVPVGILNPIRAVVGIPHHRFNLFVECSSAVLKLCNESCEAVLPLAESHSVLFQLQLDAVTSHSVLFQLSLDAFMACDGKAHAPNHNYEGKCNQYKKQSAKHIRPILNVERKAGRQ